MRKRFPRSQSYILLQKQAGESLVLDIFIYFTLFIVYTQKTGIPAKSRIPDVLSHSMRQDLNLRPLRLMTNVFMGFARAKYIKLK